MISKEILLETAKRKNLTNKEHIEKDYFQDVFLSKLFKKSNKFIFKGGTALYKLYNLNRFSEDLDFSLLNGLDFDDIKEVIENAIGETDYFKIKSIKKTDDNIFVKINCRGILTSYNTLRIDINFKNKVISGFNVKNYVSDYIDINPFSLRVLKLEEMIAEKIHSIFMKQKARHLFDLFFLLKLSKFNNDLVKSKLEIFNMKYNKKSLENKINKLGHVWHKELKPFVFSELPNFNEVKDYVLKRIG